ncbi:hypothetical protein ONS95_010108 [Cadophora gregata]|uniref:uncharacterized protein n=1 Tax=Cadophora gregata TaxID=51156 RepID=UPI0026DC2D9D|nr:uncharacterized protein ONS95_010108 [Cadophora gregata]KAK0121826.1 hypothetical protein ONS95_010108 [Cadophora gregata]
MPIHELQRRDSWPPTVVRIRDDDTEADPIDEDPFSFFLTSPEDLDDFLDEDLSAGIETPDSSSPVREVSPSSLQRSPLPDEDSDDEDVTFGLAMPLSLRDFTRKHSSSNGRKSRAGQRTDDLKGLGIALPPNAEFSASRGRAKVRLTPPPRNGRGRGQTRSLSARRPQSWRLPSPDIYSIKEERESDEEVNKGRVGEAGDQAKFVETPISASAPASTRIDQVMMGVDMAKKKPKKRVHWAL